MWSMRCGCSTVFAILRNLWVHRRLLAPTTFSYADQALAICAHLVCRLSMLLEDQLLAMLR